MCSNTRVGHLQLLEDTFPTMLFLMHPKYIGARLADGLLTAPKMPQNCPQLPHDCPICASSLFQCIIKHPHVSSVVQAPPIVV